LLLGALLPLALLACSPEGAPPADSPSDARRVVSLSPSLSSILVALGAAEQVVGVDQYSRALPELAARESLGGLFATDVERLVELRPSLVLGVESAPHASLFAQLRARGLRCVAVDSGGTLEDVLETYAQVGELVGRASEARALIARVREELARIAASTAGRPRPSVALVLDVEPLYVAGAGSFADQLIAIAGGRNVFEDLPAAYPPVSLEELAVRSPEILLDSSLPDASPAELERARARWRRFRWVRRVEFLPRGQATLPGAELARAAALIRDRLHPELGARAGGP
jgi:ABC-type Fe3+-hydroxamate transport system substrate-binding protein